MVKRLTKWVAHALATMAFSMLELLGMPKVGQRKDSERDQAEQRKGEK